MEFVRDTWVREVCRVTVIRISLGSKRIALESVFIIRIPLMSDRMARESISVSTDPLEKHTDTFGIRIGYLGTWGLPSGHTDSFEERTGSHGIRIQHTDLFDERSDGSRSVFVSTDSLEKHMDVHGIRMGYLGT